MKWFVVLLMVKTVLGASENPEENRGIHDPNLTEGDMILTPHQRYKVEHGMDVDSDRKRGSIRLRLWPNGVVPYEIHPALNSGAALSAIRAGMNEWTRKTCIRFKRRTNEAGYVSFVNVRGKGCASYVGRLGRRQEIYLEPGCWTRGIVAHEIGHAVGFYHEQSRPDRDSYVTILTQNIQPGRESAFRKYPRSTIDSLGTQYDYRSVMHYGSKAFSKNGQPTIQVKKRGFQNVIGQRRGLSRIDARQANLLYQSQCRNAPARSTRRPGPRRPGPRRPRPTRRPGPRRPRPTRRPGCRRPRPRRPRNRRPSRRRGGGRSGRSRPSRRGQRGRSGRQRSRGRKRARGDEKMM